MKTPNTPKLVKQIVTTSPAKLLSSKKVRLAMAGLALLAVGGLGYGIWSFVTPNASLEDTRGSLEHAASELGEGTDYDAAIGPLLRAVRDATTPQGKYESTVALAAMYQNKGDNENALQYFKEADAIEGVDQTVDLYLGLARSAAAEGDTELAKHNYQKAIAYYESQQSETYAIVIAQLQLQIEDLE